MKRFENIPEELKDLPQWVCHRKKIPFNPVTGALAKAGIPKTWARFEDAVTAYDKGSYDGIGYAKDKYCISNDDLDKDLDLLNLQNGTLNLKTFEFSEHRATDLISKIANVSYDPAAKSELWLRFIDEVMRGDTEKMEYLQKAIGYGITADTSLETCFILYGATTRNGKSTLVETIMHMLGGSSGYAMQMKPESLAQKQNNDSRQANGDIARLAGVRFLNVSEPPKKMIFDAALLKTLLGRDSIVARHLHEREFEFVPRFKLFMNTNYLPHI